MRSIAAAWTLRLSLIATAAIATPPRSLAQDVTGGEAAQVLRVWTYMTGEPRPTERGAAQQIARRLLADAGVGIDWRNCDETDPCTREGGSVPSVTLIVTSASRATCGTAALDPAGSSATVLISRLCVADVVLRLRQRSSARANPLLFGLEPYHLLGAAIAHEIGHVLGLPHAPTGLMRERLEVGEVLSLLQGTLTFSRSQSGRMRASTLWRSPNTAQWPLVPEPNDRRAPTHGPRRGI